MVLVVLFLFLFLFFSQLKACLGFVDEGGGGKKKLRFFKFFFFLCDFSFLGFYCGAQMAQNWTGSGAFQITVGIFIHK